MVLEQRDTSRHQPLREKPCGSKDGGRSPQSRAVVRSGKREPPGKGERPRKEDEQVEEQSREPWMHFPSRHNDCRGKRLTSVSTRGLASVRSEPHNALWH